MFREPYRLTKSFPLAFWIGFFLFSIYLLSFSGKLHIMDEMVGFAVGNMVIGRIVDRFGVTLALVGAGLAIVLGYFLATISPSIALLSLSQLLVGLGTGVVPMYAVTLVAFHRESPRPYVPISPRKAVGPADRLSRPVAAAVAHHPAGAPRRRRWIRA